MEELSHWLNMLSADPEEGTHSNADAGAAQTELQEPLDSRTLDVQETKERRDKAETSLKEARLELQAAHEEQTSIKARLKVDLLMPAQMALHVCCPQKYERAKK